MNYIRDGKTPLIAAHRGTSGGNIPCNSAAAYKAALFQGADIVEIDVSVSLDRKLFAFHPTMEHAHLNLPMPIALLTSRQVPLRYYVNQDNARTNEKVLTLDDTFEMLKDKCIVNVDKFWTAPKEISDCIRRHNMTEQVIIKTNANEKYFRIVEEIAHDIPYMVMVREKDEVSEALLKRKLNFIGIEALFKTDTAEVVSDSHIEWLHKNNLAIWGNAIVYNNHSIIAGGHTDDIAITGNPDYGWGWFKEKKFDMLQTDWLPAVRRYFGEK